ncbi:hypothetical protein HETIRDRAFT_325386 [Heterobasidion irregulare TC 32-1]|uniref:DUF6589 domain-containing protein n=1 Tax=Heterobasidion irregulare (strain TC 32-1) TaxID=747525 RepID=W4JXJ7_HETIT|nr:uncharacterized protein HETIRDRAFT_325386 [Heterobasidion irregulare TC 32-1]ETW78199.1 hypothetical protein HETIRDRAFT_325386 [Heterobasidion irregulare TC 32-1]
MVVLFFGDLGTWERVNSLLEEQTIKKSPWHRYQFIVFIMGLFHLKMACADAIWRIFINPPDARQDPNSLLKLVGQLKPKETGKITSDPGFCRMHEVIGHTSICLHLDAWHVEVNKQLVLCSTLEEWAENKPSMEEIMDLSHTLARDYVAGLGSDHVDLSVLRHDRATRDQQRENILLMHQYMLLYEELMHAMNVGDVGHLETIFAPWIAILKACGKHKYASAITQFLLDVHFVYPEGLRCVVRYNVLVNPTGQPGKFRGVDWVIELNNLFTKHIYGGSGSNFTKDNVIKESCLIGVFQNCHKNVEENFQIPGLTTCKGHKDMKRTFNKLLKYTLDSEPNVSKAGRQARYYILDMIEKGLGLIEENEYKVGSDSYRETPGGQERENEDREHEMVDIEMDEEDLRVELQDHGMFSDDGL